MVLGFFPGGKVSVELPRSGSSIVPKNCVHRTAEVQQFYGQLTLDTWKVSIELPRSAVLWMLFWPAGKVSIELPRSGSSLIPENGVHRTTKVLSSIHTKKVCSSMDTLQNCRIWQLCPSDLGKLQDIPTQIKSGHLITMNSFLLY